MKDQRSVGTVALGRGEGRPALLRRRLYTRDFDELAHAFQGWDADFRQLSRGPFHGALDLVQTGGVQLLRVAVDRVIQARGHVRPGSYTFALVTPKAEAATWLGRHLKAGQLRVMGPAAVMDHLSSDQYEVVDVSINADQLCHTAKILYGVDLEERLAGRFALNADRIAAAALDAALRTILDGTGAVPGSAEVEQTCVRRLLRVLASADPAFERPVRNVNRPALLRRAEEFMMGRLADRLRAEDLCAELDVSERTLRYAFQDRYGLSPMAYFKTQKLNAVRRRLKTAGAVDLSVNQIAGQWGFDHTGNFAAAYHRLFDELPSQTLHGQKSK